METFFKVVGAIVSVLGLVVIVSILGAYPIKWLMNYLFTSSTLYAVFGVYSFTVWRALWLGVLCGFLFKGSGSSTNK